MLSGVNGYLCNLIGCFQFRIVFDWLDSEISFNVTPFISFSAPNYYDIDGLSDPIGFPNVPEAPNIPTPHQLVDDFIIIDKKSKGRSLVFSHMLMQWGQFLDHDITFTAESEGAHRCVLPK